MRARALLADFYRATGKPQLAAQQYRLILAGSYRLKLRERAADFLQAPESHGGRSKPASPAPN